jgi:hypothetical protein
MELVVWSPWRDHATWVKWSSPRQYKLRSKINANPIRIQKRLVDVLRKSTQIISEIIGQLSVVIKNIHSAAYYRKVYPL